MIEKLYGSEYVEKAEKNADKILNEEINKKLQPIKITEELKENKIKQILKEKNIRYSYSSNSHKVFLNITSDSFFELSSI